MLKHAFSFQTSAGNNTVWREIFFVFSQPLAYVDNNRRTVYQRTLLAKASYSPALICATVFLYSREAAAPYRNTGTSSSLASRWPSSFAQVTHSSIVTPRTGMKGQTSIAPRRGCSPVTVYTNTQNVNISMETAPAVVKHAILYNQSGISEI